MSELEPLGKILLLFGSILVLLGGALLFFGRIPIFRLPGDIVIRRPNLLVYIPLTSMVVLSLVLTVVLNLLFRRGK